MRKPWVIFGILSLSLESTSCLRQRPQARVFAAPAPRARIIVPDVLPSLSDAPEIAVDEASITPPQVPGIVPDTLEGPEAPKRVARRPVTPVTPIRPTPAPTTDTPVPPRLAQMFTPEQLRENRRTLDETLDRVARELAIVEGKNLTPDQKETAERIRTFRKQAEQAREQDLLTAVSLARRADLLAKDLLERLP
jgi:hypothetical protein